MAVPISLATRAAVMPPMEWPSSDRGSQPERVDETDDVACEIAVQIPARTVRSTRHVPRASGMMTS